MSKASDPPSPDRKRSLEDDNLSDEDEERNGRHKRRALSPDTVTKVEPVEDDAKTATTPKDVPVKAAEDDSLLAVRRLSQSSEAHPNPDGGEAPVPRDAAARGDDKDFRMRALISSGEAGIIIGKGGRNISDIRAHSGAKVQISDHIPNATERVLMISGMIDQIAKAFSLVANKMVTELQSESDVPIPQRVAEVRLLIPNQLTAFFLGRHGNKTKIAEIMDNSSAQITTAGAVLPNSTERIMIVIGVIDAIHLATYHIGTNLQDQKHDLRGFINYQPLAPAAAYGDPRAPLPGYGGGAPGYGYPQSQYMPMQHPGGHHPQQYGGYGMAPPGMPAGGPSQMVQMYIPNEMVGAVIGKGGANVNEIRMSTGCKIKINSQERTATETLVTVAGSPEANQTALYMLYARLEAERNRMHTR
ncbi:hypothetical protein HKX48_000762 [Thoreauomyces humboldtii]|nr:hypothetical protein HKX48_000762 [Thoreauomyces humboldtii]